jgi:hypothetical protein
MTENKPAADVTSASTPRLKKDGTPDKRANNRGKAGNAGNRYATGRKKLPGSEPRTNLLLYTSDSEFKVMQDFCHLLKDDRAAAEKVLAELGTPPPEGKKPPTRKRKSHGIRLTDDEKELTRTMLAITKDRLTVAKMAVESAKKEQ